MRYSKDIFKQLSSIPLIGWVFKSEDNRTFNLILYWKWKIFLTKIRFKVTCFHGMYQIPHDQIFNRELESDMPMKQNVKKKKN